MSDANTLQLQQWMAATAAQEMCYADTYAWVSTVV